MQFYDSLFSKQFSWCPKLDELYFDSIDVDGASWLERTLEESEVFDVVKGRNSEKALGCDGFSMAFFQLCWEVIKADIMGVFCDFNAGRKV